MGKAPKSAYELAMERLRAADPPEKKARPLSAAQKERIAEARRVSRAKLAEREILHTHDLKDMHDPAEREKAENEYRIDRKRIEDDGNRAVEAIRREKA